MTEVVETVFPSSIFRRTAPEGGSTAADDSHNSSRCSGVRVSARRAASTSHDRNTPASTEQPDRPAAEGQALPVREPAGRSQGDDVPLLRPPGSRRADPVEPHPAHTRRPLHRRPQGPQVQAGAVNDEPLSEAKQVLLRALDSIEEIESEMDAKVQHVAVVYSVYKEDDDGQIHENGGWNHSRAPAWLIATLLRRGAESIENSPVPADEDDE